MLKKWLSFGLTREQETRYREFHLPADLAQARMGICLIILPLVGFVFNDYTSFVSVRRTHPSS